MPMKSVMPSNHFILCHPLLLLPSIFHSTNIISEESVLRIRWSKYWSVSFSISPFNEYSGLISFRIDHSPIMDKKPQNRVECKSPSLNIDSTCLPTPWPFWGILDDVNHMWRVGSNAQPWEHFKPSSCWCCRTPSLQLRMCLQLSGAKITHLESLFLKISLGWPWEAK